MAREWKQPNGAVWAVVGALVLLAGVIAIVVSAIVNQPDEDPAPIPQPGSPTRGPTLPPPSDGDAVDASALDSGWVPEPITTDPEDYVRRALEAASTFDTHLSDRDDWLTYLDTWFTPDTRYLAPADQQAAMKDAQLELRQAVVLPKDEWISLAEEQGRVAASVTGEITYVVVPEDPSGDMRIGTADVMLTFTNTDADGVEHSYDETVRVSVQVLCGEGSVPTPDSPQQPGDCKVVRYFTEPMEP